MSGWETLSDELGRWGDAGRTASLWWRDDDAARPGPALDKLLELARSYQTPLGLAVIPQRAEAELAACLDNFERIEVMQHGFAHANHADAPEKKNEFPATRPRKQRIGDLMEGGRLLRQLGLPAAVLVPPWNRFDPALAPMLPVMGLRGISSFGARPAASAAPALRQVNSHVDPINWRGARGFLGTEPVLGQLTGHLEARRMGTVDGDEPTGLLSHHLDHDAEGWDFIARLLDLTSQHSSVKWLGVAEAFGFK